MNRSEDTGTPQSPKSIPSLAKVRKRLSERQIDSFANNSLLTAINSEDKSLTFNIERHWFPDQGDNGWAAIQFFPIDNTPFDVDTRKLQGMFDEVIQLSVFSFLKDTPESGTVLRVNGTFKGALFTVDFYFKPKLEDSNASVSG